MPLPATPPRRLIGLDPGLRFTGWGVVETRAGGKLTHIADGTLPTDSKATLAARLVQIEAGLAEVFETWQPTHAGVEQSFVNRDGAATLKLGAARGVCLLVAARSGCEVVEYAPNTVKRAVTGSGHADKRQIAAMVKVLLPRAAPDSEHAADALAVAITLAHSSTARALEAAT